MSPFQIDDANSRDKYIKEVHNQYEELLRTSGDDEQIFQTLFEQNPALVPGSNCVFGESGHSPFLHTLISQPQISGIIDRIPDFMWFAKDSMTFNPVIIEIEAPNKPLFNQDGTQTAIFTKARNQLNDWKTILQRPNNILKFYEDFNIPLSLQKLRFEPSYVLIYGRRSEYEHDSTLSQKRANLMGEHEKLMSFDRIEISTKTLNCYTSIVKNGKYYAKYVSLAILVSDLFYDIYKEVKDFDKAVDRSAYLSNNRKAFIKSRVDTFLKAGPKPQTFKLPVSRFGDFIFE